MLDDLLATEPRLARLLKQARSRKVHGWRKWEAFEQYRAELDHLVGFGAEHTALKNPDAWEIAMKALKEAMRI